MSKGWTAILCRAWLVVLATPSSAGTTLIPDVPSGSVPPSGGVPAGRAPAPPATAPKTNAAIVTAGKDTARMIDWDTLLPDRERANFNIEPPPPVHDYLGERGAAARQSGSIAVDEKLGETKVKIPGFVVPLVVNDNGLVSEFFLVPYFGACIHVPPPPPNQIVYVKSAGGGFRMGSPADAVWVTGTLHTQTNGNSIAKAAYTLDASRLELYEY
jgi:uncharacterized protein